MNTGRPTRQWSAWAPQRSDGDSASSRLPPSWGEGLGFGVEGLARILGVVFRVYDLGFGV